MSAHYAIPATSFVLKAVIERALAAVYGPATSPPPVSIAPPPRADPAGGGRGAAPEPTSVLLFLYHVAPNAAWRNNFDPVIDSSGVRIARTPLVLDLHYIVAATGADLEREAVFGVALHALNRARIIPRDLIKNILTSVVVPPPPAPLMARLASEKLWEQYEQITLSQLSLDADTLSRLWTAFQSPFRPSAGILATTVFLDTEEEFPAPPSVDTVTIGARPSLDQGPASPDDETITITAPP